MSPLCIDLFCGLGGWTEAFLSEGYSVRGYDIERHDYGTGCYPALLILQDVLETHGSEFKDATVIVASPPCQNYSYMAMPWSRAKQMAREYREGIRSTNELNALFNACFRIQREASEAAGRYIPLIVENVRGAQLWVGQSKWNYGSYHLWGDVPALMPIISKRSRLKFPVSCVPQRWSEREPNVVSHNEQTKVSGQNWSRFKETGEVSPHWRMEGLKGTEEQRSGGNAVWFDEGLTKFGSKSSKRKAASAQIAKIPFPLAQHIARVFHP